VLTTPEGPVSVETNQVPYTNTRLGITFQHPASILVVEDRQSGQVVVGEYVRIYVMDVNPEDARGDAPTYDDRSDITVGPDNLPARRLNGIIGAVGGNIPQSHSTVAIPHNGKFYVLTVAEFPVGFYDASQAEHTPGPISEKVLALFEGVLGTFRFTDGG
jgi:hypothetical protein